MTSSTLKGPQDWGSVAVGGKEVPVRVLSVVLGTSLFLGLLIVRTGLHGIASLVDAVWILSLFLVISIFTRTVSIRQLLVMFLYGAFMMGFAVVFAKLFGALAPSAVRPFVVPAAEQVLMLIPAAAVLWKGRKSWVWSLGVTDVFLLAAASGLGFEMVENAYIRAAGHWGSPVIPWLPLSLESGDRIRGLHLFNGHAIWSSLAGITLGFGLLLRFRGPAIWLMAASGFVWGLFDHTALDYGFQSGTGWLRETLFFLTGNGYITLALFVLGVISVVLVDCRILYRSVPREAAALLRRLRLPLADGGWGSILASRSLTFAAYQSQRLSGDLKIQATIMRDLALLRLIDMHAEKRRQPVKEKVVTAEEPSEQPTEPLVALPAEKPVALPAEAPETSQAATTIESTPGETADKNE
jgi:hypothetical protein